MKLNIFIEHKWSNYQAKPLFLSFIVDITNVAYKLVLYNNTCGYRISISYCVTIRLRIQSSRNNVPNQIYSRRSLFCRYPKVNRKSAIEFTFPLPLSRPRIPAALNQSPRTFHFPLSEYSRDFGYSLRAGGVLYCFQYVVRIFFTANSTDLYKRI